MIEYVIGCDNAAIKLKDILKETLKHSGIPFTDIGVLTTEDETPYPLIAGQVCRQIIDSNYEKRGILICGTGIGMCISANKFRGIRAAVCHDIFSARRSILSNAGNVICFGERVIGSELAKSMLMEWVNLKFEDGSSTPKVQEIIYLEAQNFRV